MTEHPDSPELGAPAARARSLGEPAGPPEAVPLHHAEFTAFYRSGYPGLVAFLMYQGASLPDAAELAQDAMAEAFRVWLTIRNPRAWVRKVAARKLGRRLFAAEEIPTREVPEPSAALPAIPPVLEWEQRHEVLRLVASLPGRQPQVMAWTLDGYSPSEIAETLGMTPQAVRQTLRRARTALAAQLSPGRRPGLPRAAEEAGHDA